MKKSAAAWIFAAALAVGVLVAAGQIIFPSAPSLLPIPRPSDPSSDVVVVQAAPEVEEREEPTAPSSESGSVGEAPFPGSVLVSDSVERGSALDLPALGGRDGYDRDGRVTLALGLEGLNAVVERQLAVLSGGACGSFGPWTVTTASALLPPGTCALYRVLLGGAVIYAPAEPVRHDGSDPVLESLEVTEEAPREHAPGSTLFVAADAENLRPVTITMDAADPESGLAAATVRSGGTEVGVSEAPWTAEIVPTPGTIDVTVTNNAGDSSTSSVSVVADGVGPEGGTISYPSTAAAGETIAIAADPGSDSGSGLNSSSVTIERRQALLSNAGCGDFGDWNAADATDVAREGTCVQYRMRAKDNVGNESITRSEATLEVADVTAPTTAITAPAAGVELNGPTTISAEAADSGTGVRSLAIQVAVGGSDAWMELAASGTNRLSVDWNTLLVAPGAYVIRSLAVDRAGNATFSEVVPVVVAADEVRPTTSVLGPAPGETVSGAVTVSAQAKDTGSGVASLTIKVRSGCGDWIVLATFEGATSASVVWDTTNLAPGRYELRSVAVDRRGNIGISKNVAVVVEPVPPPTPPDSEPGEEPPVEEPPAEEPGEEPPAEEPPAEEPPAEEPEEEPAPSEEPPADEDEPDEEDDDEENDD